MTQAPSAHAGVDDGVAIVWALALASVLMIVTAVGAMVVGQATARMRVAAVADLAALAAAQAEGDSCTAASDVVVANGLVLTDCAVDGLDILVTVTGSPPAITGQLVAALGGEARVVSASARAGPP